MSDSAATGTSPGKMARVWAVARFLLRWSLRSLWMLTIQFFLALMLFLVWLGASESAPRWLWQEFGESVPALTISGIEGRFLTGLSIASLQWRNDKLGIAASNIELTWLPTNMLHGSVDIAQAHVGQLVVSQLRKPEETPEPLAAINLDLPFAWFLHDVQVRKLRWQGWEANPVEIANLVLSASGSGSSVQIDTLALSAFDTDLQASGKLTLQQFVPMQLALAVTNRTIPWRQQAITVQGDLKALQVMAKGPANWPLTLATTLNVVPAEPTFTAKISWPAWSVAGQPDWLIQPGSLYAAGNAKQGSGKLDLTLRLRDGAVLPWPKAWPRLAQLAGPYAWQLDGGAATASVDWLGRFGGMPWQLTGRYQQTDPAAAVLAMRLADSRIRVTGLPAVGSRFELNVPALQRFQSEFSGAVQVKGEWRGLADGSGQITTQLSQVKQGKQSLWQQLDIGIRGRLNDQTTDVRLVRDDISLQALLRGHLDVSRQVTWQGQLVQAGLDSKVAGSWHLLAPAALRLSATEQKLSRQCWQQQPYTLCADANLDAERWRANLSLDGGNLGNAALTLRRNPRQAEPPLDADVVINALNLNALPITLPQGLSLAGRVAGKLALAGSLKQPRVEGQLAWLDGTVKLPAFAIDWRPISVRANFSGNRVSWAGDLRDQEQGSARLTGSALLSKDWQATLQIQGEQLSAGLRPMARLRFSPDLKIDASPKTVKVRGQILVPFARITLEDIKAAAARPSSDAVIVIDRQGQDPRLKSTPLEAIAMDAFVTILMGDDVRVSGRGLETSLKGRLALTQRADTFLAANGELSFGSDAFFEAYGQRLTIRTGRFLFAGPIGRPDISLEAIRVVDGVTVGLRITGRSPNTSAALFADQSMTQEEMLSYLVLGRSLSNTGTPTQAEQQALALGAALKLTGRTGIFDKLGSRLGVQDFALSTEGDSSDTKVAISGNLTSKLFLSFGIGLFDQSQAVKLRYRLSPKLSLEALSSLESAITLFYTFRR